MPTRASSARVPRSVPTVPTPVMAFEVMAGARRRSAPLAVLSFPAPSDVDGATPVLGPGADGLPTGWLDAAGVTGRVGEVRTVARYGAGASANGANGSGDGSAGVAGAIGAAAPGVRWVVGLGERRHQDWRSAGASLARAVRDDAEAAGAPLTTVDVALPRDVATGEVEGLVLGLALGAYRLQVTGDPAPAPARTVRLCLDSAGTDGTGTERAGTESAGTASAGTASAGTEGTAAQDSAPESDGEAAAVRGAAVTAAVERARVLAAATAFARDLANMPSDVKSPAWLATTADRVLSGVPGLTVTVHDEHWLAEQGFGGVLSVGGGSTRPPRFVELAWRPRGSARGPHLVLVGKGVTFDTGGLSLKPAANMHVMRTDMAGAASVIAAVRAIAALDVPLRVTGLAPAAENHVSGSAYRPGDIVRHYGGTTTEVTNTDAEGRMLLADALAYAARRLRPDLLVDVATLTGAMKVSLGLRTGGVFASDDAVAARVRAAGETVGEAWWPMPLLEDVAEAVPSEVADLRQVPDGPGGVAAALFLREFIGNTPWAHLDIAGPARAEGTYAEVTPGGTGFAARTLVALAESLVDAATGLTGADDPAGP